MEHQKHSFIHPFGNTFPHGSGVLFHFRLDGGDLRNPLSATRCNGSFFREHTTAELRSGDRFTAGKTSASHLSP
ncbi:MAG: hypothetical protein E7057_05850 [Lentisphaerae bacterium]|nr:hypothetical protein [Lentisphaerota bacterium]